MTRDLESSFMSLDANDNVIPKTPAAAVLAVATYLQVTQPPEGDPRTKQHRQAILGMGMIRAKLGTKETLQPEAAPRREASPRRNPQEQEEEHPRRNCEAPRREGASLRRCDTERWRSDDRERRRPNDRNATRDARDQTTQNMVDRARAERRDHSPSSSESNDDVCGPKCFS